MAELGFKYRQRDPEPELPTARLHNHENNADRGRLKGGGMRASGRNERGPFALLPAG